MLCDINISEITDGHFYDLDDTVSITSNQCMGCSMCCRTVGDSITLDPFDIYNLSKALGKSFAEMMEREIELRLIDGAILPNILINEPEGSCKMLSEEGRCTIHKYRPGFCRMYPLGRIYDETGTFKYILQIHECPYPDKGNITIREWLGIDNAEQYETYIRKWHAITGNVRSYVDECLDPDDIKKANWMLIRIFYEKPYDTSKDFYTQFYDRMTKAGFAL